MRVTRAISKQALSFLDLQQLPPSPENYRLAFAYHDGAHSDLVCAIDAIVDGGVRMTCAEFEAIYVAFFGGSANGGSVQADAATVRHQTLRLADLAASASATTGAFSRELAWRLPDIAHADPATLQEIVATTLERSQRTEQALEATTARVEQLRQKLEAVQGDAERDALTGLPNRRGIDVHLATAPVDDGPRIVAMCDVDRFKAYNDLYGHAVGDRVLKTVATSLKEALNGHFVGRWGGEEFIVVARGTVTEGLALIEAAKAALGARYFKLRDTDEPLGRITFSAGVAVLPGDPGSRDAAVAAADALLYRAKGEGRDRVLG